MKKYTREDKHFAHSHGGLVQIMTSFLFMDDGCRFYQPLIFQGVARTTKVRLVGVVYPLFTGF